jgi:hypothetical protein
MASAKIDLDAAFVQQREEEEEEEEEEETHHFDCPLPASVQPIFFGDPQLNFMLNVMLGLQLAVQGTGTVQNVTVDLDSRPATTTVGELQPGVSSSPLARFSGVSAAASTRDAGGAGGAGAGGVEAIPELGNGKIRNG